MPAAALHVHDIECQCVTPQECEASPSRSGAGGWRQLTFQTRIANCHGNRRKAGKTIHTTYGNNDALSKSSRMEPQSSPDNFNRRSALVLAFASYISRLDLKQWMLKNSHSGYYFYFFQDFWVS